MAYIARRNTGNAVNDLPSGTTVHSTIDQPNASTISTVRDQSSNANALPAVAPGHSS